MEEIQVEDFEFFVELLGIRYENPESYISICISEESRDVSYKHSEHACCWRMEDLLLLSFAHSMRSLKTLDRSF